MASIVYPLLLFLFIFGAASTFLNGTGLYQHQLPETGLVSNSSQAQELNTGVQRAANNPDTYNFQIIFLMLNCIGGGILAILTLGPLLISYGVPPSLAAYAISPLGIILVFWIIEMVLSRYAE